MRFFGRHESSKKKRKVKKGAPKAVFSFRRHLLPPIIGLAVMLLFFIILNAPIFEAQLEYHFAKPIAPAVVEAATKKAAAGAPASSAPPTIAIPRIGLSAPVIFEPSTADGPVQAALAKGVDHYGGTADPGEAGNSVIFGHSGGELWAPGKYKYAFTLLDKVQINDKIIVAYKGVNYIYNVTGTEIIVPTNLSILSQNRPVPNLTLVTCSPVGTNKYRLVVHAVQINPVPKPAAPPAFQAAVKAQPQLPGNAHASLWQTLTGWL